MKQELTEAFIDEEIAKSVEAEEKESSKYIWNLNGIHWFFIHKSRERKGFLFSLYKILLLYPVGVLMVIILFFVHKLSVLYLYLSDGNYKNYKKEIERSWFEFSRTYFWLVLLLPIIIPTMILIYLTLYIHGFIYKR